MRNVNKVWNQKNPFRVLGLWGLGFRGLGFSRNPKELAETPCTEPPIKPCRNHRKPHKQVFSSTSKSHGKVL